MFAFFLGRQVLSPRHSQDELTGKSSAPHNLHSTLISLLSCVHPAVLQGEDELDFLIPNGPMCKLRLGEGQGVPQVPRSYCTTGRKVWDLNSSSAQTLSQQIPLPLCKWQNRDSENTAAVKDWRQDLSWKLIKSQAEWRLPPSSFTGGRQVVVGQLG